MPKTISVKIDEFDAMKETLEIISDNQLLRDIKEGIDDIRKGRTTSLKKYLDK